MLPIHVALVSDTAHVGASELATAAAAIQTQATREFGPLWGVSATVAAFPLLEDVPVGPSPADGTTQVQFLVEVCDPSDDAAFAYSIDGVLVSDFITPNFYDAVAANNIRYSFTGSIGGPVRSSRAAMSRVSQPRGRTRVAAGVAPRRGRPGTARPRCAESRDGQPPCAGGRTDPASTARAWRAQGL